MAVWVVSHCKMESRRHEIVNKLSTYISIDIYGGCGKNCSVPRGSSESPLDCHPDISHNYKFYLAFENSLCVDYVTEKFFNILSTGMIPVVYGGADYASLFPPYSFINILDFPTIEELAKYLQDLSSNPTEWRKYFEWRKNYWVMRTSDLLPGLCEICDRLVEEEMNGNAKEVSIYRNMHNWWYYGSDGDEAKVRLTPQCVENQTADRMLDAFLSPYN
jgi:hypothetical protein